MDWVRILAYITGTVDQELLLRNEYLVAENRILKAQLKTPLRLTDAERMTLAEIAYRLGRKALEDVANVVKPDTLLGWYRRLIARKFDGSKSRRYPGRPGIYAGIEHLVVRMAKENSHWGYDRIVGAMANLGLHAIRSNGWQYSAAPWYSACTVSQVHYNVDRLHPCTYVCPCGYRLFLGGGTDAAWVGHLLRAVLYPSGEPSR